MKSGQNIEQLAALTLEQLAEAEENCRRSIVALYEERREIRSMLLAKCREQERTEKREGRRSKTPADRIKALRVARSMAAQVEPPAE